MFRFASSSHRVASAAMRLVISAFLLTGVVALAQTKTVEDKKGETFNEIERGFFFGVNAGFWATAMPPASVDSPRPFLTGQSIQVEVGYDIGERVSPALFFLGAATNRAGREYRGFNPAGKSRDPQTKQLFDGAGLTGNVIPETASGDFGMLIPGATVKVRLVGFADDQGVKRGWLYVRGSGGVVFYSPSELIRSLDVLVQGGVGFEYFTRLRHFSIGVEANVHGGLLTSSVGFSVLPTVRYAF